nr:MAG TPA: hypothetical protein [Caudoviricetes sp.]
MSIGSRANTPMVFKADCMAILEDSFFSCDLSSYIVDHT